MPQGSTAGPQGISGQHGMSKEKGSEHGCWGWQTNQAMQPAKQLVVLKPTGYHHRRCYCQRRDAQGDDIIGKPCRVGARHDIPARVLHGRTQAKHGGAQKSGAY